MKNDTALETLCDSIREEALAFLDLQKAGAPISNERRTRLVSLTNQATDLLKDDRSKWAAEARTLMADLRAWYGAGVATVRSFPQSRETKRLVNQIIGSCQRRGSNGQRETRG